MNKYDRDEMRACKWFLAFAAFLCAIILYAEYHA